MKIQNLIAGKQVQIIAANQSVQNLVRTLNSFHIGALVVSSDGEFIEGIVSERDIVRAMSGNFETIEELHVRDIMTVNVHTCTPESTVSELMTMMTQERIRHVPVVNAEGKLISLVSIGDIVKHHVNEISVENKALKDYVASAN